MCFCHSKESGKELYAFLFNDIFVIIEAAQATWSEIFVTKTRTFALYKNVWIIKTNDIWKTDKVYWFLLSFFLIFIADFIGYNPLCTSKIMPSKYWQFISSFDRWQRICVLHVQSYTQVRICQDKLVQYVNGF